MDRNIRTRPGDMQYAVYEKRLRKVFESRVFLVVAEVVEFT